MVAGTMTICSCNKEFVEPGSNPVEFHDLTVSLDNYQIIESKAEDTISTPYIIAYSGGNMVDYIKAPSGTLRLPTGTYTILALVGKDDLDINSMTLNQLYLFNLDLGIDETDKNFTMLKVQGNVKVPTTSNVSLSVRRGVSKIVVKNIHRDFHNSVDKKKKLKLVSGYMINVARTLEIRNIIFPRNIPKTFYNDMQYRGECDELLYHRIGSVPIAQSGKFGMDAVFYVYPNTGEKKTKFILETEVDNKKYYYPVEFPTLRSNTVYTVNDLFLTKLGIFDPDGPWVENNSVSFTVTVTPWLDGGKLSPIK